MDIDEPVNQDVPHFLGNIFLEITYGLVLLKTYHEIQNLFLVFIDGINPFGSFSFQSILATTCRIRSLPGLNFCQLSFFINAGILFQPPIDICDIFPEDSFYILIVWSELSQPAKRSKRTIVAKAAHMR